MAINNESLSEIINDYLENFFNNKNNMKDTSIDDLDNLHRQCIEALELPLLVQVMVNVDNNQTRAAKVLGLNRNTLREKLKKYNML